MSALDRRTALLDAAVGEIASRGTRGMRIEQVARAAGVSPALIYHHFGDRSTLLQSALEHISEQANAYTEHIEGNSRENLLAGLIDEIQDEVSVRTNSAARCHQYMTRSMLSGNSSYAERSAST